MVSCSFLILVFWFSVLCAKSLVVTDEPLEPLSIYHPQVEEVVKLTVVENFDEALELTNSLIAQHPDNPCGYVLLATIYTTRSMDYEDDLDFPALLQACDSVKSKSDSFWASPDSSAYYGLYVGLSEMYRGKVAQYQSELISSARHLLRAGKHFTEAIEVDSTCWDIYHGLGMYEYYLSSSAGFLRTVGIVKDQRQIALEHLELAAERGTLTRIAAQNNLAWFALQSKNYVEAVTRTTELLQRFPGCRAFTWCQGKALIRAERWEESVPVFNFLLESVRSLARNNHYNEVTALHYLAQANVHLNNWQSVLSCANQALELELSEKVRDRKSKNLKQLSAWRERAQEELQTE